LLLLIGVPHITQLIQTNIPKTEKETITLKDQDYKFWIIMTVVPGVPLQALSPPYLLLECISFSINLLSIIKSFHAKGIVHRDLKPDNIQIKLSEDDKPLANAHITILDFGLAYIENHSGSKRIPSDNINFEKIQEEEEEEQIKRLGLITGPGTPYGNCWYRVPQLRSQKSANLSNVAKEKLIQARRSPTIDTSSVCAILFWLLTGVEPREEDRTKSNRKEASSATDEVPLLYHQKEENKLIEVVKKAVQETNEGKQWLFSRYASMVVTTPVK
jgi:serine/threonine protein kinase